MNSNIRIIARLDVKPPNLVKGIQMEGVRKLGAPNTFAHQYYLDGIDEIIYIDVVASLYERNNIFDIVRKATKNIFIPITVGGGLRSLEDVQKALEAGADKVAINTALLKNPNLITDIVETVGSQCLVLSVQTKKYDNSWEALYDSGREHSGKDAIDWIKEATQRGVGEILLTSVDQEGTQKGFDLELIQKVSQITSLPLIVSGGMGVITDIDSVISCGADAIAVASILHYQQSSVSQIKQYAHQQGHHVRPVTPQGVQCTK